MQYGHFDLENKEYVITNCPNYGEITAGYHNKSNVTKVKCKRTLSCNNVKKVERSAS